jgi:quercetin dioxygenase-like cupin family protein
VATALRHTHRISGRSTTSIDDTRIRITTWTFEDGQDTGPHVHEYDYIVVPVTGGTFEVVDPEGATREMTQQASGSYLGQAGTEHNVINRSGRTAVFVEIELKSA